MLVILLADLSKYPVRARVLKILTKPLDPDVSRDGRDEQMSEAWATGQTVLRPVHHLPFGGSSCSPSLSNLPFASLFFALFVDKVVTLKREEKGLILNDSGAGSWQGQ